MGFADIFQHVDYRSYLRKEFAGTGVQRGRRSLLAKALQCQTSFLSQVLTDRAHLSLEHAIKTSEFLLHSDAEKNFFMLLIQKARAGSKILEQYFDLQLQKILKERETIRERIGVKTELSTEDQMKYYSVWYYSAIHILCALSDFNTVDGLVRVLKLEVTTVKAALEFLEERGFIVKKGSGFGIGPRRIHLTKNSPMLPRHHANWRIKAIESVDQERENDLHYSAVMGIARKDLKVFKEKLLRLIQEFEPMIRESSEEVPAILLADFFEL